ncbi:MAG TPA: hypothetical protein VGM88_33345 [Kofleriaceae bacterium]
MEAVGSIVANRSRRDEVLMQVRELCLDDRDFIAAALARDTENYRARVEQEIIRRAEDALAHPERGLSREESLARVTAVIAAMRARSR